MTRKFKSGDRVITKPNTWADCLLPYGFDCVGTVIGYDEDGSILVKFDDFTNGHDGRSYYNWKGIKYDPYNQQHLYMLEKELCLLEGEEHDN